MRDRRRSELEGDRMRGLANAAIEGLLVCEGETIITVNDSFAALIGCSVNEMIGAQLKQCFPDKDTRFKLLENSKKGGYRLRLMRDGIKQVEQWAFQTTS